MSTYRVWYIHHSMTAQERDKWLKYRANPEQTPAPVIRYRKKRMVNDVEAESRQAAMDSINSLPAEPGDPYNRVWDCCLASDHVQKAVMEGQWLAEEVDLFSPEEIQKCAR